MHLTRRMRLIWHKLWLIPLVGATADVVASEAAKLGGVTVPIPWLFSAIGVAGMLGAAVARAYSVPLIPEGLEGPDEALTRRSRVLGERLGATPVRVFVSDLPKLRGKVDTFIDGHDLFVSERVAELPEAERAFVLARALAVRGPCGRYKAVWESAKLILASLYAIGYAVLRQLPDEVSASGWWLPFALLIFILEPIRETSTSRRFGTPEDRTWDTFALRATGDLPAAQAALRALSVTKKPWNEDMPMEAYELEVWWNTKGQKAVEASGWYQRELARASEINQIASQANSGDSPTEFPASETN